MRESTTCAKSFFLTSFNDIRSRKGGIILGRRRRRKRKRKFLWSLPLLNINTQLEKSMYPFQAMSLSRSLSLQYKRTLMVSWWRCLIIERSVHTEYKTKRKRNYFGMGLVPIFHVVVILLDVIQRQIDKSFPFYRFLSVWINLSRFCYQCHFRTLRAQCSFRML